MRTRYSEGMRRLHLDFHNPAGLPDLCADFNARELAATIRDAGFDTVTLCALCAHGHCYFPTRIGVRHPDLSFDLFGDMVEACQAEDLSVGAYFAAGCSNYADPAWSQVGANGQARSFTEQGGFSMVCLNSPHIERTVLPVTEEVLAAYPVDGVFYDLLFFMNEGCHCAYCRRLMADWKLSTARPADIREANRRTVDAFDEKAARCIRARWPGVEVTFNTLSIHERPDSLREVQYLDIESPATGGWGYFYFPPRARYLRACGTRVAGMTVGFHQSWGGFGSLKSRAQLEHECYSFVAAGAAVCIGDHLPPRGRLEPERYQRFAEVMRPLRAAAAELQGLQPLTEAAILLPPLGQGQFPSAPWAAAAKVLLEAKLQFDTVDIQAEWDRYALLVLPDESHADATTQAKLARFLARGGAVLATGDALAALPETLAADSETGSTDPTYFQARAALAEAVGGQPHFLPEGFRTLSLNGAEVWATEIKPYPKTGPQFFYPSQIPYDQATDRVVIARRGQVVAIAPALFRHYWQTGYGVYRQTIEFCLRRLLPRPLLVTNAPLSWEVALLGDGNRRAVVVVPYASLRTGEPRDQQASYVPQIEDWPAIANLEILLRDECAGAPLTFPEKVSVEVSRNEKGTRLFLPVVKGPVVVVLNA